MKMTNEQLEKALSKLPEEMSRALREEILPLKERLYQLCLKHDVALLACVQIGETGCGLAYVDPENVTHEPKHAASVRLKMASVLLRSDTPVEAAIEMVALMLSHDGEPCGHCDACLARKAEEDNTAGTEPSEPGSFMIPLGRPGGTDYIN